ncbi:hypothetical protein [Terrimonas sp.]|uniref:hypothetical protein n=1 Tax=Terrimonas sp. TaxID=1914338 RepID=UPI000E32B4E7|nr:hypothetical protein [Terrimonas sp.]
MSEKIAVLVGGSDLFSGMRGISKGTKHIYKAIHESFDEVVIINYNYFLDFGSSLKKLFNYLSSKSNTPYVILYGYSKGGDVVLQLSRMLQSALNINLLITIDVANGPWSHKIDRTIPHNVKKNINVYQSIPNFPLRSYGMQTVAVSADTIIENIDLTRQNIQETAVTHSTIENLMVDKVITWINTNVE